MLEVRKNEIALRKLSGGTAPLRTLEGTLVATPYQKIVKIKKSDLNQEFLV